MPNEYQTHHLRLLPGVQVASLVLPGHKNQRTASVDYEGPATASKHCERRGFSGREWLLDGTV